MSLFALPAIVKDKIKGIMKVFLWNGKANGRYLTKVARTDIALPFEKRGLAINS